MLRMADGQRMLRMADGQRMFWMAVSHHHHHQHHHLPPPPLQPLPPNTHSQGSEQSYPSL
eukprot:35542-Chlamydomonas_euryale.AAC.1